MATNIPIYPAGVVTLMADTTDAAIPHHLVQVTDKPIVGGVTLQWERDGEPTNIQIVLRPDGSWEAHMDVLT